MELKTVLDQVNDIIYTVNFDGIITFVNEKGLQSAPLAQESLIGYHFSVFVRSDYLPAVSGVFNQILQNGVVDSYFEFPLEFPGGQVIWLGQNTSIIEREDKEPFLLLVARDITKQKEIEFERNRIRKQVASSEMKYRSIIENMKLGLLEVDVNGLITKAYPTFCHMVQYEEENLIGRKPEDFLFDEQTRKYQDRADELGREHQGELFEVKIKTRLGQEVWALVSKTPFYDLDGNIRGYVSIHYDITSLKNLQRDLIMSREVAEKAQMAQKQFLATMSHEIRTPLNAIIGMSHLLADTDLDLDQMDSLEIIISSTNILKSLISDILDISKIDSGNIEARFDTMDLHKMFGALKKIFKIKLDQKHVGLILELDPKLKYKVIGDELLLNQILMNLVSNAVKFTHVGQITLVASVISEVENEMLVRFSIHDTGIGISDDQLSIIFDQFKQANRKIQDEYGGTGLGLAITKKLVELLGGQIQVESTFAKGSKFSFAISLGKTDIPVSVEEREMKSLAQEFHFPYPILIVEDNAMNQKYITKLLDKWKIRYDLANNGLEGVELARKNTYCLILMDLQMPVLDGFKATRLLRESDDPVLQNIPVVALTASTLLNKREEVMLAGMNEYLTKPFTPEQLAATFNRCCQLYGEKYLSLLEGVDKFIFSPLLDSDYLSELYGDDLEYALEMFEIFLQNTPAEIDMLFVTVTSKDYQGTAKITHKIKPTFNMVGLTRQSKILDELEIKAKNENVPFKEFKEVWMNRLYSIFPLIQEEVLRIQKFLNSRSLASQFTEL